MTTEKYSQEPFDMFAAEAETTPEPEVYYGVGNAIMLADRAIYLTAALDDALSGNRGNHFIDLDDNDRDIEPPKDVDQLTYVTDSRHSELYTGFRKAYREDGSIVDNRLRSEDVSNRAEEFRKKYVGPENKEVRDLFELQLIEQLPPIQRDQALSKRKKQHKRTKL